MRRRNWTTLTELAELLIARANAKKPVSLTPDTAYLVGLKLMTVDTKPTRDEVAMLLCSSKCSDPCFTCRGTANIVVRVYGERLTHVPVGRLDQP